MTLAAFQEQFSFKYLPKTVRLYRGVYPPLGSGSQPPQPPPPPDGPWGSCHGTCKMVNAYHKYRRVGREEMIEAPIIIEGAKHLRIEKSEVETLINLKYITMQS